MSPLLLLCWVRLLVTFGSSRATALQWQAPASKHCKPLRALLCCMRISLVNLRCRIKGPIQNLFFCEKCLANKVRDLQLLVIPILSTPCLYLCRRKVAARSRKKTLLKHNQSVSFSRAGGRTLPIAAAGASKYFFASHPP